MSIVEGNAELIHRYPIPSHRDSPGAALRRAVSSHRASSSAAHRVKHLDPQQRMPKTSFHSMYSVTVVVGVDVLRACMFTMHLLWAIANTAFNSIQASARAFKTSPSSPRCWMAILPMRFIGDAPIDDFHWTLSIFH